MNLTGCLLFGAMIAFAGYSMRQCIDPPVRGLLASFIVLCAKLVIIRVLGTVLIISIAAVCIFFIVGGPAMFLPQDWQRVGIIASSVGFVASFFLIGTFIDALAMIRKKPESKDDELA